MTEFENFSLKPAIKLIKEFEGLRTKAYQCSAGVWTIGYGHTGKDVYPGLVITEDEAERILVDDLGFFADGVADILDEKGIDCSENEYCALVSFAFNCGLKALRNSTLIKKLAKGDYEGASAEFMRWNRAGGKVVRGLTRRRAAERDLFDTI